VTVLASKGLSYPSGVAVDDARNVYFADSGNSAIKKWMPVNNRVTILVSSGLNLPIGVALDSAGNVYIADTGNNAIKEWMQANSNVTTLVSSGLDGPQGVAVDGAGNVYITDTGNNALKEWTVANSNVTTLVSSGLNQPNGVAVDGAGNVYIADFNNNAIEKWMPANNRLTTLVSGLNGADGVAVDGAGNVYVTDYTDHTIEKWTAANSAVTTLVPSGLNQPVGVSVDGAGNVYVADAYNNAIKELPYGFVDPTPRLEGLTAGNDSLPAVLTAAENVMGLFAPKIDQGSLFATSITEGVVSFSFTADTGPSRTALITLLGQPIIIQQGTSTYSLGAIALLEGPSAGSNSVVLAVFPAIGAWTAIANAPWLHISPANQSGTASANVVFNYDMNPGATRSGTLIIAGNTLTVTQAGSTYVAAAPVTALVTSGLSFPGGVATDGTGNVYITDYGDNAIKKWTAANNTVTTLVSSGLSGPIGVAVDGAGNVYFADTGNNAVKEWIAANSNVTTLVSSGLNGPQGVAVDGAGNVYLIDTGNNALKQWTSANSNLTTLVSSGLNHPTGVGVDCAGNVYIGDFNDSAIQKWTATNNTLTTLLSGLNGADGVAVDGAGNIYVTDYTDGAIEKWVAANGTVTSLVSYGLYQPIGVAVDVAGNVYIADTWNNAIKELPHAFVDPTPKLENGTAGSDFLPAVLPITANLLPPFYPTSDQPWLTITGVTNGVVSFSFTNNPGPGRPAVITLLGQAIPVTQVLLGPPQILTTLPVQSNGALQFAFGDTQSSSFTVVSATNPFLPLSNWTGVGTASNIAPELFEFTTQPSTSDPQRYYSVRSP
jgi:DNA-binding beta-propeller fold protein YncE